jgi:hypothetical protein
MTTQDYPAHLLARDPAPSYTGEGPFKLWHFSVNPSLDRFSPKPVAADPQGPALVWAVDARHAPMFWFPRDCPRGCIWPVGTTTPHDRDRFFAQTAASRIHVTESGWLQRLREARLFAYELPIDEFRPHDVGGYWITDQPVDAISQEPIDDLIGRHAQAGIELRITPSIRPFWRQVVDSTVEFSGMRLRNAAPHPEQFD